MNYFTKLFYNIVEISDLEQVQNNFDLIRTRILDDAQTIEALQSKLVLLLTALTIIQNYTATQKSGTAQKVHRTAKDASR